MHAMNNEKPIQQEDKEISLRNAIHKFMLSRINYAIKGQAMGYQIAGLHECLGYVKEVKRSIADNKDEIPSLKCPDALMNNEKFVTLFKNTNEACQEMFALKKDTPDIKCTSLDSLEQIFEKKVNELLEMIKSDAESTEKLEAETYADLEKAFDKTHPIKIDDLEIPICEALYHVRESNVDSKISNDIISCIYNIWKETKKIPDDQFKFLPFIAIGIRQQYLTQLSGDNKPTLTTVNIIRESQEEGAEAEIVGAEVKVEKSVEADEKVEKDEAEIEADDDVNDNSAEQNSENNLAKEADAEAENKRQKELSKEALFEQRTSKLQSFTSEFFKTQPKGANDAKQWRVHKADSNILFTLMQTKDKATALVAYLAQQQLYAYAADKPMNNGKYPVSVNFAKKI